MRPPLVAIGRNPAITLSTLCILAAFCLHPAIARRSRGKADDKERKEGSLEHRCRLRAALWKYGDGVADMARADMLPVGGVGALPPAAVAVSLLLAQQEHNFPTLFQASVQYDNALVYGDFEVIILDDSAPACGEMNATDNSLEYPHFNPYNQTHGEPTECERHAGDLAVLSLPKASRSAGTTQLDPFVRLHGPDTVVGRRVIFSKMLAEDFQTPVACGTITKAPSGHLPNETARNEIYAFVFGNFWTITGRDEAEWDPDEYKPVTVDTDERNAATFTLAGIGVGGLALLWLALVPKAAARTESAINRRMRQRHPDVFALHRRVIRWRVRQSNECK